MYIFYMYILHTITHTRMGFAPKIYSSAFVFLPQYSDFVFEALHLGGCGVCDVEPFDRHRTVPLTTEDRPE